ncbi:MAG: hypothetical protein KBD83_01150 [Gammaproteobacteria bacterium]|nr:hypothetical protein [Gammaproteobacteria bacterium]
MNNYSKWATSEIIFAIVALVFIVFLQGAVPFLMIPTLGQAVWTMGFAESFTHGSFFTIYAHDFGIPKPAAIAFGLAGAWPASLLLRLGFAAPDAYATMVMLWITVAFCSAYMIARKFGNTRSMALLGAVAWMSMPVIWNHSGYSMLSLGMGLLSFYFLAAMKLFLIESSVDKPSRSVILFYLLAVILSVFMDGYTFMMFFTGATILLAFIMKTRVELRPIYKRIVLPVHIASFIFAYTLYSIFIGRAHFTKSPIDIFRGFGLDLSFIAIPTKGVLWLFDVLGLSVARSDKLYFGDASAWLTTFSLPIIIAGLIAWCLTRKNIKLAKGIILIAVFGFYMSLGPSLKINSVKPQDQQLGSAMPVSLAVMPTGNAWMSKALPGFNNMRSTYRWSALEIFALWWLVMICVAKTQRRGKRIWSGVIFIIILLNLPNLSQKVRLNIDQRMQFFNIDQILISELKQRINKNEIVAFIPWRNDFFANYLAPTAGFRTFNIGGDKDLIDAQKYWPENMQASGSAPLDSEKISAGVKMLVDGTSDVLVLPYFDMLWAAHAWPCGGRANKHFSSEGLYTCLVPYKETVYPLIMMLQTLPNIEVTDSPLFATVRLKSKS